MFFARSGLLDLLAAAATMLLKVQLQDQVSNFFSFASDELTREPLLQIQRLFKVNYGILVTEKGVYSINFLKQPSKSISNPSITAETKEAQTSLHDTVTGFRVKFQFLHDNHIHTYPYHTLLMVNTKQVIATSLRYISIRTYSRQIPCILIRSDRFLISNNGEKHFGHKTHTIIL